MCINTLNPKKSVVGGNKKWNKMKRLIPIELNTKENVGGESTHGKLYKTSMGFTHKLCR